MKSIYIPVHKRKRLGVTTAGEIKIFERSNPKKQRKHKSKKHKKTKKRHKKRGRPKKYKR